MEPGHEHGRLKHYSDTSVGYDAPVSRRGALLNSVPGAFGCVPGGLKGALKDVDCEDCLWLARSLMSRKCARKWVQGSDPDDVPLF